MDIYPSGYLSKQVTTYSYYGMRKNNQETCEVYAALQTIERFNFVPVTELRSVRFFSFDPGKVIRQLTELL